jgi:hypothetical protein
MAKAQKEEQKRVEEEEKEVERLRKEDQDMLKKTEEVGHNWIDEEDQPGMGTEGEGHGYAGAQGGTTMEGPGWEGDITEKLGDEPQVDESATFFYEDGERELVEEKDIGIAGRVAARRTAGGCQVARTPPS